MLPLMGSIWINWYLFDPYLHPFCQQGWKDKDRFQWAFGEQDRAPSLLKLTPLDSHLAGANNKFKNAQLSWDWGGWKGLQSTERLHCHLIDSVQYACNSSSPLLGHQEQEARAPSSRNSRQVQCNTELPTGEKRISCMLPYSRGFEELLESLGMTPLLTIVLCMISLQSLTLMKPHQLLPPL